jgi:hypothetical protein
VRTRPWRDSQDGVSQQEAAPLFLPQLDSLNEANIMRGEGASNVAVAASFWGPEEADTSDTPALAKDHKQTFAVSRRAEQLRLHTQQRVVATVKDSALRAEMGALESQEEDAPKRVLWYKLVASVLIH